MPASSARWMIRIESDSSALPHGPNIIVPKHSGLTETPVRPRILFCMVSRTFRDCFRNNGFVGVMRRWDAWGRYGLIMTLSASRVSMAA